jgi:hypothetical protein
MVNDKGVRFNRFATATAVIYLNREAGRTRLRAAESVETSGDSAGIGARPISQYDACVAKVDQPTLDKNLKGRG